MSNEPRPSRVMTSRDRMLKTENRESLDDYIDAVARALALPVDEAWRPAVRANLEVSLRLARLVDEFALPDEIEPASVFAA
jgi:1-carboxybiuret hydrolase subunit AtzG-like protein